MFNNRPTDVISSGSRAEITNAFMRGVYVWMTIGLAVTAVMAFLTLNTEAMFRFVFGSKVVFYGLLIAEVGLVFAVSGMIHKMTPAMATGLFLLYSALNGVTISAILLVYTKSSVITAFVTAAGTFGAMSVYGLVTKRDLTSWGSFLMMGVVGLLIAMVVNIFVGSSTMSLLISCVAVFVFLGLTAYETQAIRDMGESAPMDDPAAIQRGTILGALNLYINFINIFIHLLRIMGDRR